MEGSRKSIVDGAAAKHLKLLKKGRKSKKHVALFDRLITKFRTARSKGNMVSFRWIYTHASRLNKEMHPGAKRLSPSVVINFIRKYKIKVRRVQRKKQHHKSSYTNDLMNWHCQIREGLIKTGAILPYYDVKWGRYTPDRRFNVDQTPLPFVIDRKTTYQESTPKGKKEKVWISQPSCGLEKRQCTLQICFSPVKDKCRVAIIFRGTGKRISADEKKHITKETMCTGRVARGLIVLCPWSG